MSISVVNTSLAVSELLTPAANGTNTVFFTSVVYRAGTISVWVNGVLYEKQSSVSGYLEVNGNSVVMLTAPEAGDTLQVQYEALYAAS